MLYIRYNKPSKRTAELVKRRRQRLYSNHDGLMKGDRDTTRPKDSSPSTTPVAIMAEQVTESSAKAYISITLLGKVTMVLHAPGGISRNVQLDINPKTIQLLAYLAWQRDSLVNRELLLEKIWGHGRTGSRANNEKLGEAFNDAKKTLRSAIRMGVEQLNTEQGQELFSSALDIFEHRHQMWWLSPLCRIIDLEELEKQYKIIKEAEKRGVLFNTVPDHVKEACYVIIDMLYTGDFLQSLIINYPDAFDPWYSSWVRDPVTHYRDYYLQAILYAAQHEQEAAKSVLSIDSLSNIEMQRERLGRAAELYKTYAMSACSNRFDLKIYFGLPNRGDGERVKRSEEAMRNSIKLYGKLGNLNLIDETYNAYCDLMRDISDENWEPSEETLRVVQVARERAAAYRLEE